MRRLALGALVAAIAVAVVGATWAATREAPFLSETWNHLFVASELDGLGAALALDRVPLRPLQHALVFLWQRTDASPAEARALTFALHLGAVLLVAHLARALGCTGWRALVPPLLFLAFPSVKGLAWVDAVGGPGRVLCLLAALACLLRFRREREAGWTAGTGAGAGLVLAFVAALGFHQSAVVLPALVVLLLWGLEGGPLRRGFWRGVGRAARRALEWAPLAVIVLGAAYLVYVGGLRAERYHGVVQPGAIAANVVKASLALAPEGLRWPAVEGLRGHAGTVGTALGGLAVLGVGAAFAAACLRGAPLVRALLLGAAADLVLPVLSTGFVLRYAVLAAALVALALGVALERARGPRTRRWLGVGALALAAGWAADHVRDVREVRAAGRIAERVVARAAAARWAAGPDAQVFLVDVPDVWGREADVPLFNWGLPFALRAAGAEGPWRLLRTYPSRTSTDHVEISAATLASLIARGEGPVLVFDPTREELVRAPGPVEDR